MKFEIKAVEEELPRNQATHSAFCKGALAWRLDVPRNPYMRFLIPLRRAWDKGWQLANEGKIDVTIFCQHEGCEQRGCPCEVPWNYDEPLDKPREYEYYCAEHAFEHGYCYFCGQFWAGCLEFDFDPSHLCPNCRSKMREEEDDDVDDILEEEDDDVDDILDPL